MDSTGGHQSDGGWHVGREQIHWTAWWEADEVLNLYFDEHGILL